MAEPGAPSVKGAAVLARAALLASPRDGLRPPLTAHRPPPRLRHPPRGFQPPGGRGPTGAGPGREVVPKDASIPRVDRRVRGRGSPGPGGEPDGPAEKQGGGWKWKRQPFGW